MRLHSVSVRVGAETVRLVAEAESDQRSGRFELYFEYPIEYEQFVSASADTFAAAMLVPAMFQNERLQIDPPLSPGLLFNLPRLRDIFHAWHPSLSRCEIQATAGPAAPKPPTNRAATFFSGGVDSFYTLLKHRRGGELPAPLTHIIFMRGIEKPLDFARDVEASQRRAERIAAAAGVRCITGESNIRTYFEPDWRRQYSGSALAACALSLANGFDSVCIPASYSYSDQVTIGTTPLTDERFSTEHLQIVHDGSELPRSEKTARIIEWDRDLVLAHLRVCVLNYGGDYNCCKCWKCVRTAIPLDYLGVLDAAQTFPDKTTDHWEAVLEADSMQCVEDNLRFGRTHNTKPELTALLETVVRRRHFRRGLRTAFENSPIRSLVPALLSARQRVRRLAGLAHKPPPAPESDAVRS
ncbi:MAG TPA: hypothetical protein VFT47_05725 [Vicinamibacterales bacterium]|nr:hypothetical protein [Vicinamibacterales bacterium]